MFPNPPHIKSALTRRDVLVRAAHGFGSIALASLLPAPASAAAQRINPLAAKPPHMPAKAKSIIFLFNVGGPSQIYTFDPKPALEKFNGQKLPESYGTVVSQFTKGDTPLLRSPWKFHKYGQCGRDVSTLFPHIAQCVDDMCFVRNFYTDSTVHAPAMYQVNTGRILMGFPSMGSWITYGLGSESENLPAYVVMPQPEGTPEGGTPCWGAGFLPAVYQGTVFRSGANPILNLRPSDETMTAARQRRTLNFLQQMNEMDTLDGDTEMAARISSYELAFRMQSHAPEAVDMSKETEATRRMYGIDQKRTNEFGTRCLLARRLVERGVRFVQLYSGGGPVSTQWDAHKDLVGNHEKMCGMTDLPVAGLLKDLKQRGLLDSTLVIWGAEFGRLPMSQGGDGRDHNPHAFTMWFAGGGVKPGTIIGETDEMGLRGVGSRYSMRDFHATILQLLGLDQNRLWFLHNGRNEKLTDFGGTVIGEMLA
jgi:hypothetical protein